MHQSLTQLIEELLDSAFGQAIGMGYNSVEELAALGEGKDEVEEFLGVREGGREGGRE